MTAARPVLMSIRPAYARAILNGTKGAEFRTRFAARVPADVVVYATAPVSAIVGRFTAERVDRAAPERLWEMHGHHGGIAKDDYDAYFSGRASQACALVIVDPQPYEDPSPLAALGLARPPQSWMFLPVPPTAPD